MERHEYETLYRLEDGYWWYRGLREVLADVVRELRLSRGARCLDAGCGTGRNLEAMAAEPGLAAYGFDLSPWALPFLGARGLGGRVCRASTNAMPFRDASFDLTLSVDVLECEGVEGEHAYGEMWRVTRPGGAIVIVAAAYPWLLSRHDRAVHSVDRYTRGRLAALVGSRPLASVRVTHLFPTLFPLIAAHRLVSRWLDSDRGEPARSDLKPLPRIIDQAFYGVTALERRMLRHIDFAWGTSLLAVARKA